MKPGIEKGFGRATASIAALALGACATGPVEMQRPSTRLDSCAFVPAELDGAVALVAVGQAMLNIRSAQLYTPGFQQAYSITARAMRDAPVATETAYWISSDLAYGGYGMQAEIIDGALRQECGRALIVQLFIENPTAIAETN